ncbi:chemotaxis protein CheW [Povalibacter sp.]|uniref:chemotaxis protein CheW n=1 Tax=Povalibacter sp. TaxID=1962978 RepID=UPI002F3EF33F
METPITNSSVRFLTFRAGAQLYALRCEDVSEVIRVPAIARIPQGPAALLGVANLRGSVLPVASLRELLGKPVAAESPGARAIVLDVGAPVALVVDSVETLETVAAAQIETRKKELSAEGAEKLTGAFSIGRDQSVAKILDIKALLEAAFVNRARPQPIRNVAASISAESAARDSRPSEMLVTFDVAGQEFALPLDAVEEILQAPAMLTAVARSEIAVLGVVSVRDSLLPLLSLRTLLGFAAPQAPDDREKVVVVKVAGTHVGLVADRARAILVADTDLVDPIPPVIAARTGGESRIRSIYRGENGRRLISILAPEQLFREDVMQRLVAGHNSQESPVSPDESGNRAQLIFLVFRLGNEEFGLPIDTIVEVAQVPSQITRVPKAPRFLEGVVNLRGDVLPVVDQRRRFDMPPLDDTEARRLVVIRTERHRAGLIVDSVSDVLRIFADSIEPAPELTDEMTRLVRGVVNLEKSNRIVLLLDPTEVLTRAERKLLDTFHETSKKANV